MAHPPVPVVLPLVGEAVALLDAVSVLVARWPQDVDAQLVVPSGPLSRRDRGLLESLGEDVRLVQLDQDAPCFGALVAAVDSPVPLVVLDPAALPGAEALARLASGVAAPGGVVVEAAAFAAAPVLTAAHDLPSLAALLTALEPLPADVPVAAGPAPAVPAGGGVPVRPGLVSVVVPVRGGLARTQACLASVRRSTRVPLEVVVVDDGSTDGTRAWLATQRDLVVVAGQGRGHAAACNRGVAAARGETVVLLDSDAVVGRFWAEGLLRVLAAEPRAGAVGTRSTNGSGSLDVPQADYTDLASFRPWADAWRRAHAGRSEQVARLSGPCLALRREDLLAAGGLDEGYEGSALAVEDLLVRLRHRDRSLHVAHDVVVHREGGPAAASEPDAARLRATLRRHGVPALSAALIVKDEQASLPRCLASLRGVVDEVVVCDTGSSDRTVEVALAFGARVVHTPWTGDFAAARNTVLEHCRGAWVLSVDADEQLGQAPDTDLALTALAHPGDALSLRIRSRSDVESAATFEHAAGRLFRREELHWVGAVHETLVSSRTGRLPVYQSCGAWLDHDGYLSDVYAARDKATRNLQLAEKDHEQSLASGDRDRLWKTGYELARALSKQEGEEERVEQLLVEALVHMPAGLRHLRCDAHVRLATARARLGHLEDAEAAAREAVATAPTDPAALLVLAQLLSVAERHEEALAVAEGCSRGDASAAVRDLAKAEVDLPLLRARLLHRLGRTAEAAATLLDLAATQLGALDWPLLHDCLRDHVEGVAVLADVAARDPQAALAALDGLPAQERDELHAALAALGVDADAHTPDALRARRLDGVLRGHDPEAVAQAALALEDTDLVSALDLWSRVPDSPLARAARARCLLQLGRVDDAVAAVEGLDVAALDTADLLVVVAVAAAAGDADTARQLLEHADRTAPPELQAAVSSLAATLALPLPDRVHPAR